MKRLSALLKVNMALAVLFSFLCFSPRADVSLLAAPVALIFSWLLFVSVYRPLLARGDISHLVAIRRVLQYEPFAFISTFVIQRSGDKGFPVAFDFLCATLWLVLLGISIWLQFCIADKRIAKISVEWDHWLKAHPRVKPVGVKRVVFEALEWVDALLQAVFTIMLLNIFVFQLYEIPSESMVPTFLVKDRVAVFKTPAGPKMPLSEAGLPYLQEYQRGDIVVFRNPHYASDRKAERKTFFSQFLYMCTLTILKTNTDENGELKADPLVKRVCALPGEQIYMLDGKLYARTEDDPVFRVVEEDTSWAAWNLNELDDKTKRKVQMFPLSDELYESALRVEEARRQLDLTEAASECQSLFDRFREIALAHSDINNIEEKRTQSEHTQSERTQSGTDGEFFSQKELSVFEFLQGARAETLSLLTAPGGLSWLNGFLNRWHEENDLSSALMGGDPYSDSVFRLNVMAKLCFARQAVRYAELLGQGVPPESWSQDEILEQAQSDAIELCFYVLEMDLRNLSVFPANTHEGTPTFIPEHCYFMMGDNRYNSLDMRHSYQSTLVPLSELDPVSLTYRTQISPQWVDRNRILGKASLRFWPPSRIGFPAKDN